MTKNLSRQRIFFLFLAFLFSTCVSAQTTRVKGRVIDASTKEGIPFAGVYFKNSTVGVSTDENGYYTIEVRNDTLRVLSATILGYETLEKPVAVGAFREIDFALSPVMDELSAAVVKPDDSYVRSILRRINEAKPRNNPELREGYEADLYSKIEVDLQNADSKLIKNLLPRNFMFVYDYMDTSVVSGKPYLPVMISESASKLYHKTKPEQSKEEIKASRISGIDKEPTIAQFLGGMHQKPNFYEEFIELFGAQIPSPANSSGPMFYNYYLIDSLDIDGRKTYKIRYHPSKWVSSPTFDGEMSVDASDFALREVHAKLKKGSNVNWVRDLVIDVKNVLLPDSTWFYQQDKIYADFSVTLRDSSKMISMIGRRQVDYMSGRNTDFKDSDIFDSKSSVRFDLDVMNSDEDYWASVRPYELTDKEKGIYQMVDSIKNVPLYKSIETVAETFVTGFCDVSGYFGLGPYSTLYSFNNLEGSRVQLGARTTRDLSHKFRLMAYGAYGFKDRDFKVGGTFEYVFKNQPMRKLMAMFKRDVMQLGAGNYSYGSGNIFTSVLAKQGGQKLSPVNDYSISYSHEVSQDVNLSFALESRRIFSNQFVPMVTSDGRMFNSVGYNQLRFSSRFSWDEIVTRGVFDKHYVYSPYPVVSIDLIGSVKGFGNNSFSYFRPELSSRYVLKIPPVGTSRFYLSSGMIVGRVPYPMLYIFQGNGTYTLNEDAFSCMDYYEFAADTWTTFIWIHDFKGFFLGKIPLLKKMQLRELAMVKVAYGTLTNKNNGIPGDRDFGAVMKFPDGMGTLDKPYVEVGVGVTNIFRMLRVDASWRLTHRNDAVSGERLRPGSLFSVNVGFEFKL